MVFASLPQRAARSAPALRVRAAACSDLRPSSPRRCSSHAPPATVGAMSLPLVPAGRTQHRDGQSRAEDVAVLDRRPRDAAERPRPSARCSARMSPPPRRCCDPPPIRSRQRGERVDLDVRETAGVEPFEEVHRREESRPRQQPALGGRLFVDRNAFSRASDRGDVGDIVLVARRASAIGRRHGGALLEQRQAAPTEVAIRQGQTPARATGCVRLSTAPARSAS